MKKSFLVVLGTRPEAIKLAPVIKELKARDCCIVKVFSSGQHVQLLAGILENFDIVPDFQGSAMVSGQRLDELFSRILHDFELVTAEFMPDLVLVHGDTTTAFAAAFGAFLKKVPVAHIEAGLRTSDLYSPFPEEGNRRLIGSLASYHFAPTSGAMRNLLSEGVSPPKIIVTGNTVIDALLYIKQRILAGELTSSLDGFDRPVGRCLLVTLHRRENLGSNLVQICDAFRQIAIAFPDVYFFWPVHMNPAVYDYVNSQFSGNKQFFLCDALDYVSFIDALCDCFLVLTDSGGVQEEVPSLNKPVLVLRDVTERPEVVEVGAAILVGSDPVLIFESVSRLLTDQAFYDAMATAPNPFGDGTASKKIADSLLENRPL